MIVAVAVVAAAATTVTGLVLAEVYRPVAPGTDPALLSSTRTSAAWLDRHLVAAITLLVSAIVTAVVVALRVARPARTPRSGSLALGGAVVAVLAAGVALGTRSMGAWDQVGLWAVSDGSVLSGYRLAADEDLARFVLVDGRELAPGRYRLVLAVHLGAPVVALAALATVSWTLWRERSRDRPAGASPEPATPR